jgi:proteasome lid subunit RPN8/RPN11
VTRPADSCEQQSGCLTPRRPLTVAPALVEDIRGHATRAYPRECCGFLVGTFEPARTVRRVVRANNASLDRCHRFAIDPGEFLKVDRDASASGAHILGFYHSHPDSPGVPSRVDLDQAWPSYSYLIVAVDADGHCQYRSWAVEEQSAQFVEEPLDLGDADR